MARGDRLRDIDRSAARNDRMRQNPRRMMMSADMSNIQMCI